MFNFLQVQAAMHTAHFMDVATPATSRQIGFLTLICKRRSIDIATIEAAIEHYNGGNTAWGLDKECASVIISAYVTPEVMEAAAQAKAKKAGR